MFILTSTYTPSQHIEDRSKHMWATKYDSGEHTVTYKVTPFGRGFEHLSKDRRFVIFDLRRATALCVSMETGEQCEANSYGRLCSHVHAASKRVQAAAKRVRPLLKAA